MIPKKILIIEDDSLIIKILDFILKKEGYETHISIDGNDGIAQIELFKPDLIITDVMMPYKSGLEITAFSKKNYPKIPVIIVSALGKEDLTVIEGFKLGVDDFVAKPFNPIELTLRVKRFLL
ncbi:MULTISPECIES: response regulator transcription factor [unclassified Flavobacterium]|uniref:response regulator transcription factor n=1 Tax=unclassified Flavobacterium TaxID=196869 RepID=UPI00156F3301|nr:MULTISPECIES: response regulator [unclassified Flavobacterium]MBE0390535.1 Transcriptional regulatory protein YycF [Flavobacterium sp. PL002]NRT15624.1 DNA-binding response OmpR family regulator [Flavobacterium sp. 28A]